MLKTLKKIAFERVAGTPQEDKVFEILSGEVSSRGLEYSLEPFQIKTFQRGTGKITLLTDKPREFSANPVGLSGSADITGRMQYVEPAKIDNLRDIDAPIVIVPSQMGFWDYQKLTIADKKAFIIVTSPGRKPGFHSLRQDSVERFGRIPGVVVSYEIGLKLIENEKTKIRLVTEQTEFESTSHNLVVKIPGEIEGEDILLCAHADSVAGSPGAVDNGAGCVELLGLLGHFAKHKPLRNMIFCFFGGEELGLLGSQAYVKAHSDELDKLRIIINLDLGGDIFGNNKAYITGDQEIAGYIDSRGKLKGYGLKVNRGIYSSDNMPFAREGIPAISFGRSGLAGIMGHSPDDDVRNVDERSLRAMAGIALDFADELANAKAFPFERKVPDDVKREVDKYFMERYGIESKEDK